jgi:DNA-directed RNA polymerase subunit RPC12/RpoP
MFAKEVINKLHNPDKLIPPAPHYPYWRYFCPDCQTWWESELQRTRFVVDCPDCHSKGKG